MRFSVIVFLFFGVFFYADQLSRDLIQSINDEILNENGSEMLTLTF